MQAAASAKSATGKQATAAPTFLPVHCRSRSIRNSSSSSCLLTCSTSAALPSLTMLGPASSTWYNRSAC